MPKPANTSNPPCPVCGGVTQKHDKTKADSQRYKCGPCKKVFTPKKKKRTIGDRPMTAAEKQRRYREKKKG